MNHTQAHVKTMEIPAEKLERSFPEHIVFDDEMPGFGGCRGRVGNRTGPISLNTNWARSIAV